MSTDIVIGIDRQPFDSQLDDAEADAKRALASIATGIRRTAEVGIYFAQASGVVIDQVLSLQIEAGLRIIEFATATRALLASTTAGVSEIVRLGFQAGAIALMFVQIHQLQNQRYESAQQTGYAVSLLRHFTF